MLALEPDVLLDPEAAAPSGGVLLVENGRIAARLAAGVRTPESARRVALPGLALAPGFLDVHYHGALIFTLPRAARAALEAAGRELLATGVTGFLATTVTWPARELSAYVEAWAAAAAQLANAAEAASVLGLHLEGPWIRPEAAGAQPRSGIRPYRAEDAALFDRAAGLVPLVTLAPEAEGADLLLAELARRGIAASLGHTLASAEQCERAIAQGARHATHLFNAMGAFHQRAPGLIGTALASDALSCDLICDGVHVHPSAVRAAARAKRDRLALITDNVAVPAADQNANALASFDAGAVHDDGVALRLADGTLAGSRLSLDRAVANAEAFGAMSRLEAVRAATLAPARLLGIERERGTLREGARADFALLDASGAIAETWLAGRCVYRRGDDR
ncbi:MAG: N-acetylglucosamine-6-phosphate deacetylase [Deltaproteobacteria bacterium]|nr:N-acetylglucosamine-6-phosphate deacetylase [Deltaproteobacteria bacterium]